MGSGYIRLINAESGKLYKYHSLSGGCQHLSKSCLGYNGILESSAGEMLN